MGSHLDSFQQDLQAAPWPLLAGDLGLDFVNTVECRASPQAVEFLSSPPRLLAWCWRAGTLPEREVERLARATLASPARAQALLAQALALREAWFRVFSGLVQHKLPTAAQLRPLNAALQRLALQRRLAPQAGGIGWAWADGGDAFAPLLGPPCLAAAQLLSAPALASLRQCPGCGWLFLDTSRNHTRRWCSMAFCGSRMKSRRQYQRRLGAAPDTSA